MKKLPLMLITICITVIVSCKKEVATTSTNNNASEAASIQNATIDQLVSSGTEFGVGGFDNLTTDQKIILYNKLGVQYVRAQVTLKDFKGDIGGPKKLTEQGFKVILNLNWAHVPKNGEDKVATAWPRDMNSYRQKLGEVLSKFKPEIAVIENEPTVDIFHSGPIEDYITELTNAIQVCKQYGVKIADGAIHVPLILQVMRGGNLSDNAIEVKKLIAAYRTLDLDYVNVHDHGGNSYPAGSFERAANYLRQQTGKPIISNEFSLAESSSSILQDMVNGLKKGDYKIALVRSSSGDRSVALNQGTDLLPLGTAYRDMIK